MKIRIITGDITELQVDAIVNAANCSLAGGGGVDGAIHAAAGPELLRACLALGGCPTGEARITPGFRLGAAFVIHTPGPVWRGGGNNEPALLRACYLNSLALAAANGCRSAAFPCLSTGVYRFPRRRAAEIAVDAVTGWRKELPEEVVFCCYSPDDAAIYREILPAD